MATVREIRRRIRSVKNIAKVTSALETVAASRVKKAQNQALATRAYAEAALDILHDIARHQKGDISHPYLDDRPLVANIAVVLITSDRGLAGSYNSNVIRAAMDFEKQQSVPVRYITIGRKGRDRVVRRGRNVVAEFADLPAAPTILDISAIVRVVVDDFLSEQVDEVFLAYTRFVNMLRQEPHVKRLLPLHPIQPEAPQPPAEGKPAQPSAIYTYEPDPDSILNYVLPRFTELQLYQALLESLASEHAARLVAMRTATENANELAGDLTLSYNKARQLAITSEIFDIVGGAQALVQTGSE